MLKRLYNAFTQAALMMIAVVFLSPQFSYCQKGAIAPHWISDGWREMNYPKKEWYVGFSQDVLSKKSDVSRVIERLEKEAQNKMTQGITVNISSTSQTRTASSQVQQGQKVREAIDKDYEQIINASTNAQVVKTQTYSYHDTKNNKAYAFAAVRKSDLASYYASVIEAGLGEAQREFDLAMQLAQAGKSKDAAEKLVQSKSKIESLSQYSDLLLAVDVENGLKRTQRERTGELLKKISAEQIELQSGMLIYLTSKEIILGQETDIILSGLQTFLSENNCRVANSKETAGFILDIEASVANPRTDGTFHYCNAAVRVNLINAKTSKNEAVININGPKEGCISAQAAAEAAFKAAVPAVWSRIKDRVVVK